MKIYIPTLNRPTCQLTAAALAGAGIKFTLVVDSDDKNEYKFPHIRWGKGRLRAKRQWITDQAEGKFIMMDDDLKFFARSPDGKTFKPASPADIQFMVRCLGNGLNVFPHGGIMKRFMGHAKPRVCVYDTGYISLAAYNKSLWKWPHPKFRLEMFPDDDFCLQLLSTSHSCFVLTEIAFTENGAAPGGMNTFRTQKAKFEDRMKMVKFFPGVVVRKPEFKGGWLKKWERTGTHQQFRFNFRKAYENSNRHI